MSTETHDWKGISGKTYRHYVYDLNTSLKDAPGNYIFAKKVGSVWKAVYVGQTGSLSDRILNHDKWDCARKNGATHIHAHINNYGESARLAEEADLVKGHNPPCNLQ